MWLPLPVGVNTIQVSGYGSAKLTVVVSTDTSAGNAVARRVVDCLESGVSTLLSGIGRREAESRYLYISSSAASQVSVVITTFPLA